MSEPITASVVLKAVSLLKTPALWVYRRLKNDTPEKRAIAATAAHFSSWPVKSALRKVLKAPEFQIGLERVRDGGEFGVDEKKVTIFIARGQFFTGLKRTTADAWQVLKVLEGSYREALLQSPNANVVADQRAGERHRELLHEIRDSRATKASSGEELEKAREAARKLIAHWMAAVKLGDSEPIVLRAIKLDAQGHEITLVQFADLRSLLQRGGRIIRQGPAGRGKTTTLLQLADSDDPEQLHLYVDLPAWIDSGRPILTFLSETPEFQSLGISGEDLAQLSDSMRFVFYLNGWNEISENVFRQAATLLKQLQVSFPLAGVIFATRSVNVGPALSDVVRISLLPLNERERRECIERSGVARSEELIAEIENRPLLDALTRTPLFLSYLIAIFSGGGTLPSTRVGVLSEIVKSIETSTDKQSRLEGDPLWGNASEYLTSLSVAMTVNGATRLSINEARVIVSVVTAALQERKQIVRLREPNSILDALCKHHVLERVDYPIAFRFQHQQFQEFYASQHLKQELLVVHREDNPGSRLNFARQYLNRPIWDEPLQMLAEEIGAMGASDEFGPAGVLLVEVALDVDPVLAADLARLCGTAVWKQVASAVGQPLRSIYDTEDENFKLWAAAGMLATGSPELMDIIVPLLSGSDEQILRGTYRTAGQFRLTSLGENWQTVVKQWTERARIILVEELALTESTPNLTRILEDFARNDPSQQVKKEAMKSLVWVGAERELIAVLATAGDAVLEEVLNEMIPQRVPFALRDRYLNLTLQRYESATDTVIRLKLLLRVVELGNQQMVQRFKDELVALTPDQIQDDVNEYILKPILEIICPTDPQWVSDWVAARFLERTLSREDLLTFVTNVSQKVRDEILEVVSGEDLRHPRFSGLIQLARVVADSVVAQAIFERWVALRGVIEGQEHVIPNPQRVLANQLEEVFQSLRPGIAVAGFAHCFGGEIEYSQLTAIIEYLNRVKRNKVNLIEELPRDLRQGLRIYLQRGISFILKLEDVDGRDKATAALALATVGEPEDARHLRELLLADVERMKAVRTARLRGERSPLAMRGLIIQAGQQIAALKPLDPESVEPMLLEALQEPEYEGDAASALVDLATVADSADPFKYPKDYGAIWQARSGHPQRIFDEGLRQKYANAITEAIARLRKNPKESQIWTTSEYRLQELNKALATLDGSSSLVLEVALITAKNDGWRTVEALERLLFSGGALRTDRALEILNIIIESARLRRDYDDQARQLLIICLCVLPFVTDPDVGIERLRHIMSETGLKGYQLREVVTALGSCASNEALALLREFVMSENEGLRAVTGEWIVAVATLNGPTGEEMLLSFIDPNIEGLAAPFDVSSQGDHLASRLAQMAHANRKTMERILALSTQSLTGIRRDLFLNLISKIGTDEAVLAGLELLDDADKNPIPYHLSKAVDDKLFNKQPIAETGTSYNLEPRSANEVRGKLFSLASSGDHRSRSALKRLGEIEVRRLEYERPPSESRHPLIDSGLPWPPR